MALERFLSSTADMSGTAQESLRYDQVSYGSQVREYKMLVIVQLGH